MSRPTTPTSEFFSNFEGFLKKFKLTTENHKDQEILTLANLDSGRIRKFIVKKVDERSLFGRRNSQKSLKDENENKSRKSSLRKKNLKKEKKQDGKRRLSASSLRSLRSLKASCNIKGFGSSKSLASERNRTPEKKKRRSSFGSGKFRLGWGSSSESDSDDAFETNIAKMTVQERNDENKDPGFTNEALVKGESEDEELDVGHKETEEMEIKQKEPGDASDTDSMSSLDTGSPSGSPRFNLKMSPIPKRSRNKKVEPGNSPVSFRGGYQSNRSSISSVRKGILKKTNSCTTINMEMANLSRPQTPTESKSVESFEEAYANGDTTHFARTGDNPHLRHQRSFNRVKFILDSGRPDNITGDYDDIKIEKNDKTDRSDKGKEAEVSNSYLSRSGKKCLIFTTGLLLMTVAVIVGTFYGSRKPESPQALPAEGAKFNKHIAFALEGKFKISNENFSPILYNFESDEFKKMSKLLEDVMVKAIFVEESANQANSTIKLRVVRYEKGSVITIFRIKWEQEPSLELAEIRKRIWEHLEKYGAFGEYKVEKQSFSISELRDLCDGNPQSCSHICVLSDESLRFVCTCPDNLILVNNTNCISPKPTTTTAKNPVLIPAVINKILKVSNADLVSVNQETVTKEQASPPVGEKPPNAKEDIEKLGDEVAANATSTIDKKSVENANSSDTDGKEPSIPSLEKSKEKDHKNVTIQETSDNVTATKDLLHNNTETKEIDHPKEPSQDTKPEQTKSSADDVSAKEVIPKVSSGNHTEDKLINATADVHTSENGKETNILTTAIEESIPKTNESVEYDVKSNTSSPVSINKTIDANNTKLHAKEDKIESVSNIEGKVYSENETEPGIEIIPLNSTISSYEIISSTKESPETQLSNETKEIHSSNDTNLINSTDIQEIKESILENRDVKPSEAISYETLHKESNTGENTNKNNGSIVVVTLVPEIYLAVDPNLNEVTQKTAKVDKSTKDQKEKKGNITSANDMLGHEGPNISKSSIDNEAEINNDTLISSNDETILEGANIALQDKNENKSAVVNNSLQNTNVTNSSAVISSTTSPLSSSQTTLSLPTAEHIMNATTQIISIASPTIEALTPNETDHPKKEISTVQEVPQKGVTDSPVALPTPLVHLITSASSVNRIVDQDNSSKSNPDFQIDFGLISNVSHDLSIPVSNQPKIESNNAYDPLNTNESLLNTEVKSTISTEYKEAASASNNITSTTPQPVCDEGHFLCSNGTCLSKASRCDSVFDCLDKSDEEECSENQCFDNYQCRSSGECLNREFVCDGVKHCPNGDDEENCESWNCTADEFQCSPGSASLCIPLTRKCDGHTDCINRTDELNCTAECPKDHFLCPEQSCIPNLWKCDGNSDCLNGEDELDCDCEGLDQSPCSVGGCVPTFKLCDGLRQCPDGSDEWGCLKIDNDTKQLQVRSSGGRWSAICGDKWTAQWTDLVCEQLGFGVSLSTEVKRVSESTLVPRMRLSPDASEISRKGRAPLQYFLTHGECAHDPLVHVSCKTQECGQWNISSSELGYLNDSDVWPSLGLLIQPESHDSAAFVGECTASIITPTWIITSYSCLASKQNGFEAEGWAFITGESSPKAREGNTQLRYAKQIVIYPGAKRVRNIWVGDVALLRLETPLKYSPHIQPICVSDQPVLSQSQCIIASWTMLYKDSKSAKEKSPHQIIQALQMPNATDGMCNNSVYGEQLSDGHLCASFLQDENSSCTGHEGSPLMCKNFNGSWQLHGLLSHAGSCASFNLPSVFTDVTGINSWILNTIGRVTSISASTTVQSSTTIQSSTTVQSSTTTHLEKESTTVKTDSSVIPPAAEAEIADSKESNNKQDVNISRDTSISNSDVNSS